MLITYIYVLKNAYFVNWKNFVMGRISKQTQNKLKELVLACLEANLGILTAALSQAEESGFRIARRTVDNWKQVDKEFADKYQQVLDDMKDTRLDLAEHGLFQCIALRSEKSIHYYLDRFGRERGYIPPADRLDINQTITHQGLEELTNEELEAIVVDGYGKAMKTNKVDTSRMLGDDIEVLQYEVMEEEQDEIEPEQGE